MTTIEEVIAKEYGEFLHQEGAHERTQDFARWLLQHIADAGYELVKSAGRRCDGCTDACPATRACPCGRIYCGRCECDCEDWTFNDGDLDAPVRPIKTVQLPEALL